MRYPTYLQRWIGWKRKIHVFSLVSNNCSHDARVLKEARALADAGYAVRIYARADPSCPISETRNNVEIRRFKIPSFDGRPPEDPSDELLSTLGKLRGSLEKDLLADRKGEWRDPAIRREERSARREIERRLEVYFYGEALLRQEFERRPDIIHAHDLDTLPAAVALARRTGASVVYDAHELEAERNPPLSKAGKTFVRGIEKHLLRSVDRVIVCGDSIADEYRRIFDPDRLTIIYNSPETSPSPDLVPDIRQAAGLPSHVPIIVYTGIVSSRGRGLEQTMLALRHLVGFHLVVMGPRATIADDWIRQTSMDIGVADRLHLLPPVRHDCVVAAIRSADVAVCAIQDICLSYRYSMPNKLFEAAFAGVPLCVSNLPDMRAFVCELGIGRTMDAADPDSIAEAVSDVHRNRSKYTLTTEKRRIAEQVYSWPAQAERLTRMYREMIAAKERARRGTESGPASERLPV